MYNGIMVTCIGSIIVAKTTIKSRSLPQNLSRANPKATNGAERNMPIREPKAMMQEFLKGMEKDVSLHISEKFCQATGLGNHFIG